MSDSIFITEDDRETPLLTAQYEYEPLFDDDDDIEDVGDENYYRSVREVGDEFLLPFWQQQQPTELLNMPAECFFDDIYRYFWARGLWKFITGELSQLIILSWLVLFCIFLGTCVNYAGIASFQGTSSPRSIWQFIGVQQRSMNWFFVAALVLYSVYAVWCLVKFARDIHRMRKMQKFYRETLGISDYTLRTARWSEIVARLSRVIGASHRIGMICALPNIDRTNTIASVVTKKHNCYQMLLQTGLIDFTFQASFRGYTVELSMLTRGLQWNLMQIVNFFFDSNSQLRTDLHPGRLKRRIVILAVVNLLLLPFLIVFVALYALFRYGEQFYKDPSSAGARQWSLAAKWYFRSYNEMPHVLEERLRLSSKYADRYIKQFAAGALQHAARAIAFISGSIVVWLLLLSVINEHVLLSMELSSDKAILWWITILSSVWAVCRGLLHEQHVFYPGAALEVVHGVVRRLPPHFLQNANSKHVNRQFRQLYPLRVVTLFQEFLGLVLTPYIMLKRVHPAAEQLITSVNESTEYSEALHFYIESNGSEPENSQEADYDETAVLQSEHLIPHLRKLDG